MILATFTKQPADTLDYDVDFTDWLPDGDVISSVAPSADAGITLGATTISADGKAVKQWVSGGEDGKTYKITIRVTTAMARVKEAEFKVKVRET